MMSGHKLLIRRRGREGVLWRMTRFRGIRGLIGKRPDRERSEKRRREWKEERVSNLFSFLKVAEEGGGGGGIPSPNDFLRM